MTTDSATYAYSTSWLLAPPRPEDIDIDMPSAPSNTLLSVIIYLQSPPDNDDEQDTTVGCLSLDCHTLTCHHRTANLGIIIAPEHQGEGYGTEAINWALDWAFAIAGMHAVPLTAFSYNEGAIRLYERLGPVKEGARRGLLYFDSRWHHHFMCSMLEREWAALSGRKIS